MDDLLEAVKRRMKSAPGGINYSTAFEAEWALRHPALQTAVNAFDPSQPRDEKGRWIDFGGGTSEAMSKAFESATVPVRKRVSFGDQVAFMAGDKADVGVITGGDNGEGIEITLASGAKIRRKMDKLRMPKGGIRVRD